MLSNYMRLLLSLDQRAPPPVFITIFIRNTLSSGIKALSYKRAVRTFYVKHSYVAEICMRCEKQLETKIQHFY